MRTLIHAPARDLLFLAIVLFVALSTSSSALPCAILPPLWLFVAAVFTLPVDGAFSNDDFTHAPFQPAVSNRAPPIV